MIDLTTHLGKDEEMKIEGTLEENTHHKNSAKFLTACDARQQEQIQQAKLPGD